MILNFLFIYYFNMEDQQKQTPNLLKQVKPLQIHKPKKLVIPKEIQEKPGEKLAEFVSMSEVRKLIEEAVEPFKVIPKIQNELKTHTNLLRDYQVTQKAVIKDIKNINESLKEFSQVDRRIKKLEQEFDNLRKR